MDWGWSGPGPTRSSLLTDHITGPAVVAAVAAVAIPFRRQAPLFAVVVVAFVRGLVVVAEEVGMAARLT